MYVRVSSIHASLAQRAAYVWCAISPRSVKYNQFSMCVHMYFTVANHLLLKLKENQN